MTTRTNAGRTGPADDASGREKLWGPYLGERQWGTVREDYSAGGDAWSAFPHDHARSRAYRWGEDGLGGICDEKQRLCFALALWNGRDPILKERAFGLTNGEGNHGEDVKEYYFHLDSTPGHTYLKYLYKYPQAAFPYLDLVTTNRNRGRHEFEYELLDTGVFDDDRYFDVTVEYAKAAPDDILIRITAENRGPDEAPLHLLPTLWFRNTWSWQHGGGAEKPRLAVVRSPAGTSAVRAEHPALGSYDLRCGGQPRLLFTENETNTERLYGTPNASPYVKDGIGRQVAGGEEKAVNPAQEGTKAAAHYILTIPAGGAASVRLRLAPAGSSMPLGRDFDAVFRARQAEADAFHRGLAPPGASEDEARVLRQAVAGLLWSKQYYAYDVESWLAGHGLDPWTAPDHAVRNGAWFHMACDDVISMPDTWEYPWFAAWDLAFQAVALSVADLPFAKEQLELLLRDTYLHPNGQVPAYEWNFGDVNPPVHAWAAYFVYALEELRTGHADRAFLDRVFQKLLTNFTWWVNRKDPSGRNLFQGGFLGLDNIGVFDRSAQLPTGGYLEQADGTAWMALYCQTMLQIALELVRHDPTGYEDHVLKFAEHFLWISAAVHRTGGDGLWDEEDGFFYDVLRLPDGRATRLKVRSVWGCCRCAPRPCCGPDSWPGCAASVTGCTASSTATPPCRRAWHRRWRARRAGRGCCPSSTRNGWSACCPGCCPRRSSSARTASGRSPGTTPTTPTRSGSTAPSTASAICPPSPTPGCSAATPTGAGPSGSPPTRSSSAGCSTSTRTTVTASPWSAPPAPACG